MKNSKLIELFSTLTKPELREFEKFLRSPYFNLREDVLHLFQYLQSKIGGNESALTKPAAFQVLFPGKPFDEKLIRYSMSFLYNQLKAYLRQKELEANPLQAQILTLKALRKRNVERIFDAEWQASKRAVESQPYRNMDAHFFGYSLHFEQLQNAIYKSRSATPGLSELSKELTLFYIANVLHQACISTSYLSVSKMNHPPALLPQVLAYVSEHDFSDVPDVLLYYHCYLMLVGDEPMQNFRLLMEGFEKFGHIFPNHELKGIYILALNFCIRKVNDSRMEFKPELFRLYKAGLSNGVFLENNQLSRFTYKNIVASGLGLNQFDWVRSFIEEYKPFLDKKYRQSTYCFNLALYHFKREEYKEAMLLLQQVGTDDLLNNLNARRILLRIYYDLGEMEALHSLLDSFQTYIYRKKDLGYHREYYLNLIRATRKLVHLDLHDKRQVAQLRSEIEAKESVYEKPWLLEKLQ